MKNPRCSQIATTSGNLKFSKALPFAFTEHEAIQAANLLASSQAVEMGIYVVRAFVQSRQLLDAVRELTTPLAGC